MFSSRRSDGTRTHLILREITALRRRARQRGRFTWQLDTVMRAYLAIKSALIIHSSTVYSPSVGLRELSCRQRRLLSLSIALSRPSRSRSSDLHTNDITVPLFIGGGGGGGPSKWLDHWLDCCNAVHHTTLSVSCAVRIIPRTRKRVRDSVRAIHLYFFLGWSKRIRAIYASVFLI